MLAADNESRRAVPWWPGVLGAWIFLILGFGALAGLGERPFDPLLDLETGLGLSAWILDPLLRLLVSLGVDGGVLRPVYFLISGLGVLCLGLALRHRLELVPLSLVLFIVGTWPWTLRDPSGLLTAPHHLRLLILGLMALCLRHTGPRAIVLPAILGILRQGLVGGLDWQIDVLFLFLIYSTLHGHRWNSTGRHALYGIGVFAVSVYVLQTLGLTSGRVPVPAGLSGFEDSSVDFGTILIYRPSFLLLSAGLIWLLLASRPRRMIRVFTSTLLYCLGLVLFVLTFADARFFLDAQNELLERDRKAMLQALPAATPPKGLLLIDIPIHLRSALLRQIPMEDWGRLSKLDTWDSGSEIHLPEDFKETFGMIALRYGPMGPMQARPSALALLPAFPMARLLSDKADRFAMRLEDMVSLGTVPNYIGSEDVEGYLVKWMSKEGRQISEGAEMLELDPSAVRMSTEVQGPKLILTFETESARSFVVATAMGRGRVQPFDVDRDPIQAVSLDGESTVLDYLLSLGPRVREEPDTSGYKVGAAEGLEVHPFAWVPGYGPVFLVKKKAGGKASFEFVTQR